MQRREFHKYSQVEMHAAPWSTDQITMSSATVWNGCMTSLVVWGPSADSSRLEVQLHWRAVISRIRQCCVKLCCMPVWLGATIPNSCSLHSASFLHPTQILYIYIIIFLNLLIHIIKFEKLSDHSCGRAYLSYLYKNVCQRDLNLQKIGLAFEKRTVWRLSVALATVSVYLLYILFVYFVYTKNCTQITFSFITKN